MIFIESKKRKIDRIVAQHRNADILDITSKSDKRYAQILSPFFPHGGIPVPYSPGYYSCCVEAIWQGLKVFQSADIDISMFSNDTMKNLKRTTKRYGNPLGHRKGVNGCELLDYFTARRLIYLPSYKWILENVQEVKDVLEKIKVRSLTNDIVFLDYNTNIDFRDISSPLSHAGLVKLYIEGNYPSEDEECMPLTQEEIYLNKLSQNKKSSNDSQLTLF